MPPPSAPGSGAAAAGIKVGDLITSVDGVDVNSSESLVALVRSSEVDQKLSITLVRGGNESHVDVTLGSSHG